MARRMQPDYLYKRPPSDIWWLRLQFTGEASKISGKKDFRISLKTTDRQQAEIAAAPYILQHKYVLASAKGKSVETINLEDKKLPIGEHWQQEGSKVVATDTHIIKIGTDGSISQKEQESGIRLSLIDPLAKPITNPDDAVIETWITQNQVGKYLTMEGRKVWGIFKKITNNKPLKQCERDDGRKMVAYLSEQGDKMATVRKKISHLNAAVNIAISDGKLRFNPFTGVAPTATDGLNRIPLSNDDLRLCNENIHKLSGHDQLLWRLLTLTGMRLDEAFQIDEEFEESNIRFVIAGTKTPQSKRRVPLPTPLLPILPSKITGRLFAGTTKAAGKRIRYWLKDLGISYDPDNETGDPRKVPHSLRHRAKDRLRAAGCPLEIQYELLGHEKKTVASGYGAGSPVSILAKWMAKIGEGETKTESDSPHPNMLDDGRRMLDLD